MAALGTTDPPSPESTGPQGKRKPPEERAPWLAWVLFLLLGLPFLVMAALTFLAAARIYVEPLRMLWQPWPPDVLKPFIGIAAFAATVAYYYRFQAPEPQRKTAVTANDLQEACRLADRDRLVKPAQTLINAHGQGLLDKAGERGSYAINTVGENLVAMALPNSAPSAKPTRRRTPRAGRPASKKRRLSKPRVARRGRK